MNAAKGPLLVALLLGFAAPFVLAQDDVETVKLGYKSYKKWDIVLPQETFKPVNGKIAIPHEGGDGFVAEIDGTALAVDSNGDGRPDAKAKGTSGLVKLRGKTVDGDSFLYSVRLENAGGNAWRWAASGAMVGKLAGEMIRLIDQNGDGDYDDVGEDAIIVGKGDAAAFLSEVINVRGELFAISVSADGSEIQARPFQGETGTLDLSSEFDCRGKLVAAVVKSADGRLSFDLAVARSGMSVPAGEYRLVSGMVAQGKETARVRGGDRPLRVAANETFALSWGGPVRAEFEYARNGDQVTFDPAKVWYYGRAGEEYYDWVPDAVSPQFVLVKKAGKRKVAEARFGGC